MFTTVLTKLLLRFLNFPLLYPARVHPGQHHGLLHDTALPHAGKQLHKSSSKRRGEESIEDGICAGVAVGKDMGANLEENIIIIFP